jgi:hypothetical protein
MKNLKQSHNQEGARIESYDFNICDKQAIDEDRRTATTRLGKEAKVQRENTADVERKMKI